MLDTLRTARGVMRSLGQHYYSHRAAALDKLYGQFVAPGDLVFDIGAHVGGRVTAFRRLGATVVAVEPQPALVLTLNLLYGRDPSVAIVPSAVGRAPGSVRMLINVNNPTVSSASNDFVRAACGAAGWEGQVWDKSLRVPMTTLDALIAAHGVPAFIKIDVEGFEQEVLAGLTRPVRALSFEFTTIQRQVAQACVTRCVELGLTRFGAAIGDARELGAWCAAGPMIDWLGQLPHAANSGDVYAMAA
jgi:FkbM family methyltransferase